MKGAAPPVIIGIILVAIAAVAIYYTIGPGSPGKVFSTGTGAGGKECEIKGGYARGITVKDGQYLIYGSKVFLCKDGNLSLMLDASAKLANADCPALIKDGSRYKVVNYAPGSVVCTKNPTSYKACPSVPATQGRIGRLLIYPYVCKGNENFYWECTYYGWKYMLESPKEAKETLSEDIAESQQEIKTRDACDDLKDAVEKYKVPCEGAEFWLKAKYPEDHWNGYSYVKVSLPDKEGKVRILRHTKGVPADILPGEVPCYGTNGAWCFPMESRFLVSYGAKSLIKKAEKETKDLLSFIVQTNLTTEHYNSLLELKDRGLLETGEGGRVKLRGTIEREDEMYYIRVVSNGIEWFLCSNFDRILGSTEPDLTVWPETDLYYWIRSNLSGGSPNLGICRESGKSSLAELSEYVKKKYRTKAGQESMLVDKEELVGGVVVLDSNFKLWELGIMDGSGCQPIKKYPASTVEQGTALEQLAKFIADMNAFDLVKTKDLCLVDMEDQNNFMVLKYASALVRAYDLNRVRTDLGRFT